MKKFLSKLIGALLATSLVLGSVSIADFTPLSAVSTEAASTVTIYDCKGVQEAAYIEWAAVSGTNHYYVSYSKDGTNFTQIDDELIRQYPDRWRADIVGLSAGTYKIKVTCKDANNSVIAEGIKDNVSVIANDRTGFAFAPTSTFYSLGGPGAYKMDGTLKDGAKVIYVTEDNFDTITLDLVNGTGSAYTATGVADICSTMGAAANKGYTNPPLAIRFLGTLGGTHTGLTGGIIELKVDQGDKAVNITFEGIGQDTIFNVLAICIKGASNCEIRNIAFSEFTDDAVGFSNKPNSNNWVHNCDFFYGVQGSGDKVKGDGATDVKDDSKYMTISYNHYWDNGKLGLCGMKSESGENYISYHHNWFDHTDSRHPRVRTMSVHVYNNYFDGNSKYGPGASLNSSIFVEGNYFRNTKYPMLQGSMGHDSNGSGGSNTFDDATPSGKIKAYNNYMTGSNIQFTADNSTTVNGVYGGDAYVVSTRNENVPSTYNIAGTTYNNFDTTGEVSSYIQSLTIDTPETAKNLATTYAGRVGNHFKYTFTEADDTNSERVTALDNTFKSYASDSSDDFVSYGGASDGSGPVPVVTTTEATTVSEGSTEITTNGKEETSSETTTQAVVNPPVGDSVINQSMTISRGTNDSYVTVYEDKNTTGAWKIDKASGSTVRGYIKIVLGKTADVTINGGGEKAILVSNTAGDTNGKSLGQGTSVTATGLTAGTWYIYNTGGNMTVSDIVVKINGDNPTPTPVVGDADGDGKVSLADVQMVLDYASGKITAVTNPTLADVNGDGKITAYDAYLIGKIILGL